MFFFLTGKTATRCVKILIFHIEFFAIMLKVISVIVTLLGLSSAMKIGVGIGDMTGIF
jgi:hypothetical protein